MWKSIKNISSAVADLAIIAGKEITHQANNVSNATEGVTSKLSHKAADLRSSYEASLKEREAGITKPVVVSESETPSNIVPVN